MATNPGAILYATYFYTSKELSIRLSIFWSTLNIARVISALLAAGILKMRGIAGRPGWFWLFLLEGILTCVLAVIAFLYLPASPTDTKSVLLRKPWYTEREEVIMTNRILRDDPAKGLTSLKEPIAIKDIKAAWCDSFRASISMGRTKCLMSAKTREMAGVRVNHGRSAGLGRKMRVSRTVYLERRT